MLGNIYYSIGILVLLSVISSLIKFGRLYSIFEWREKYEKIIGRVPNRKDYRTKKEYSLVQSNQILLAFELIWILIGFFSINWSFFALLIIFSYLLNVLLKPLKWTLLHKLVFFSFLLTKISLYLYLILNHFFLHKETYNIITNYVLK